MMMSESVLRRLVIGQFVALIALGLAWELWLAPLRPGAWLLSLKVVPLILALPGLIRGDIRTYQWWSMVVMIYLAEGLVRGGSDSGPSVLLGWIEAGLATGSFATILLYVRARRLAA